MIKHSSWTPSASSNTLKKRSDTLHTIRSFFYNRNIYEVETPLLSQYSVTDPHIDSISSKLYQATYFLQTSPEFFMKRLLASNSDSIFQICKAFRHEQSSPTHSAEFTMLEWYHIGIDYHALMSEVEALITPLLSQSIDVKKYSYQSIFFTYCQLNPLNCSIQQLEQFVVNNISEVQQAENFSRDDWLDLIMALFIQKNMPDNQLIFIFDYPASQASLAQLSSINPLVAERFECFFNGIELANGFQELQNAEIQQERFKENQNTRQHNKQPAMDIDIHFLQALQHGLPFCSGVALGIDRLMMIILNKHNIEECMSFSDI
ncbi:MAG: EF-P lysine aminoacylase GenX [Methylococcales bacterium]|jgi:elongation factor P--(R)-beta-lysine ligase|nr:EF-P lysine aminoacylase GenX [Methylococcales bacterium]MBT7409270.1 EF-P lysine aminoacylase GenX [Methylococcales bacterium]